MCERGIPAVQVELSFRPGRRPPSTCVLVDPCIAPIVQALNDAGILTVASCCGHGMRPGNIALADGRELVIASNYEEARLVERAFPSLSEAQEEPMDGTGYAPGGSA